MSYTSRALCEALRENDPGAADHFARELDRRYRNFALLHLPGPEADDFLQTLFVESLAAVCSPRLRTPDALWPFLFGVAKHLMQTAIRNRRFNRTRVVSINDAAQQGDIRLTRRVKSPNVITPTETAISRTDRTTMRHDLNRSLRRALDQLPPVGRTLLERLYFGDQPRLLIQRELRLTARQYYTHKRKALLRMRRGGEDLRAA